MGARQRAVPQGEWNFVLVVLGARGTGKSTYALHRLVAIARETPAYAFAHDPAYRLRPRMPRSMGPDAPIVRYGSIEEGIRGLGERPSAVHTFATDDGLPVLELAERASAASIMRHGGTRGVPSVVLLDEAVATPGTNPHRISPELRQFLALCRHKHVGLIVTAQNPRMLHYLFLDGATEIAVFRLRGNRGLDRLEEMDLAGFDRAKVAALENFRHLSFSVG